MNEIERALSGGKTVTEPRLDDGKSFWGNATSGRWAGEQMMKALKAGKPFDVNALRTADTLRKDEWVAFDEVLIEEAQIRLRGVADLMGAGLVIPIPNAMGKTVYQYEDVTDMNPAEVSMDGVARTENDRQTFSLNSLPLPITHKDFNLHLRTLAASRERGEPLDTMQARTAGRLVSEEAERMLFLGGKTFGGLTITGYTTHPDRNIASFGTGGAWSGAKTGEQILTDLFTMIAGLEADRMYGPYWVYVPRASSTKLEDDFKANSDKTIRQRIMEVDGIANVVVADQLTTANVVLVQATIDVAAWGDGVSVQTVQWDVDGGFVIKFKAFQIGIPVIRSDAQGRSGIFHMS